MQKKIESGVFLGVFQSLIIMECCACRRVIGYKDGFGVDGVSHGYCPDCESQLKAVIADCLKNGDLTKSFDAFLIDNDITLKKD